MLFINLVVVHCSATRADDDIGVDEIDAWHRAKGWNGCGYHFVIRRNGLIEHGRDVEIQGAHARGFNEKSVGICLVGGLDRYGQPDANFTYRQYRSLYELLIREYPSIKTVGHRDLSPDLDGDGSISGNERMKECPCFNVTEFIRYATEDATEHWLDT